jgi:membrane-associated phospholipid phosphatase
LFHINRLSVFLFIFCSHIAFAQNADINLLKHININRNKNLDGTAIFLSESVAPLCVGIPAVMFVKGSLQKDKTLKRNALVTGSSFVLAVGSGYVIKELVKRQRPYLSYSEIELYGPKESGFSFPSNHSSSSFSMATALSIIYPKWYVIVPAYTWAGSVAYSRMHIGVHYPSDVLAGAVLGAGSAWVCYYLNKKLFIGAKKHDHYNPSF